MNGQTIDGQGIFQTGSTEDGVWAKDDMDASMVEFMGMGINGKGGLKHFGAYKLIKFVIYD